MLFSWVTLLWVKIILVCEDPAACSTSVRPASVAHCTGHRPLPQDGDCNQFVILCVLPVLRHFLSSQLQKRRNFWIFCTILPIFTLCLPAAKSSSSTQLSIIITFCNQPRNLGVGPQTFRLPPSASASKPQHRAQPVPPSAEQSRLRLLSAASPPGLRPPQTLYPLPSPYM